MEIGASAFISSWYQKEFEEPSVHGVVHNFGMMLGN